MRDPWILTAAELREEERWLKLSRTEQELEIYVGNIKKFMAMPGKSDDNYAVRVTSVIREEE